MQVQKLTSKYFYLRNYIIAKKLATPAKLITTKFTEKSRVLRKLNSENTLIKNWNILEVLQTYTEDTKNRSLQITKSNSVMHFLTQPNIIKYTPIYLSLTKEFTLLEWEKKRQFFFFFNEILHSLDQSNKTLLKEMSFFFDQKTAYLKEKAEITLFENYLNNIFYLKNSKLSYGLNVTSALFLRSTQNLLISNALYLITNRILNSKVNNGNSLVIKENVLDLFSYWNAEYQRWELYGLPNNITLSTLENKNLDLILKQNKVSSVIRRRTSRILKNNLRVNNLNVKNTNFNLKSLVWKTNTHFNTNNFFSSIAKISRLYNKDYNLSNKKTSIQILYLISRIEEKILSYSNITNKSSTLAKLIRLRNLLLYLIQEKKVRVMSAQSVLTTKTAILRIRTKTWKLKLLTYLQNTLEKSNLEKEHSFYNFVNLIYNRLSLGRKGLPVKVVGEKNNTSISNTSKNFIFGSTSATNKFFKSSARKTIILSRIKSWNSKIVNLKRNWVGSKLVLAEKSLTFVQKKAILSSWINRPVDLFFINALSLTKFAFKNERLNSPNNNPNTFLSVLDRDLINKYKYIGIYIKDLVRVAFISVFFKKPSFLAKFMAFQLSKLPRNRKETNFVRFLIKVIKTFAAERKEILGIRIRFKGRVNRWRRTKFILGNRGTLPLQTISERIEQGTAQAINKKGAVGIRIWLRYKESFSVVLKDHILKYLNYSKVLKLRKINKTLLLK